MKQIKIENNGVEQLITVPGNSKVTIDGNVIVFEHLKIVPKVGDCVKLYFKDKYIAYFVCKENGKFIPKKSFLCNVLENGYTVTKTNLELDYNGNCEYDIQEEQQFQAELAQLGFEYNFENDTISEIKWKPKEGERYFYFTGSYPCETYYAKCRLDDSRIEFGNCFKTSELCQQAIDKIKQVLNEK